MTNFKYALLIITFIILFIGVIWTVVSLLQNSPEEIRYSDTEIINSSDNQLSPKANVNIFQASSNNEDLVESRPIEQSNNLLNSWQDSGNIKHSDYKKDMRTLKKEPVVEKEKGVITETTQTTETTQDSHNPWRWLQRTALKPTKELPQENTKILAMRDYGNNYGKKIKLFAITTGDQPKIMNEFIQGRGNPGNTDALLSLAQKYIDLAEELLKIDGPENIKVFGIALANAYREVGEATIELSKMTSSDEGAINYIHAYNKSVDNFAREFVALSSVFGAFGIKFNKGEGGDILMPPM